MTTKNSTKTNESDFVALLHTMYNATMQQHFSCCCEVAQQTCNKTDKSINTTTSKGPFVAKCCNATATPKNTCCRPVARVKIDTFFDKFSEIKTAWSECPECRGFGYLTWTAGKQTFVDMQMPCPGCRVKVDPDALAKYKEALLAEINEED
jgi:hypothetical protein